MKPADAKKARALALALAGATNRAIAADIGVTDETVRRWRADPEFDAALREAQGEVLDAVHAILVARAAVVATRTADLACGIDEVDLTDRPHAVRVPAMAAVNATRAFWELLGRHKNAPVQPTERTDATETDEDALRILAALPEDLLRRSLELRAKGAKERAL